MDNFAKMITELLRQGEICYEGIDRTDHIAKLRENIDRYYNAIEIEEAILEVKTEGLELEETIEEEQFEKFEYDEIEEEQF